MYHTALFLHLLSACVWTGGHLVLAATILPNALKNKDIDFISRFENAYEKIGIPALIIQVLSGAYLAQHMLPNNISLFDFDNVASRLISYKLILLGLTALFAVDARLRIIPKLTPERLPSLAWHILPVTVVSVLFLLVGFSFRTGWL